MESKNIDYATQATVQKLKYQLKIEEQNHLLEVRSKFENLLHEHIMEEIKAMKDAGLEEPPRKRSKIKRA